MARIGIIGGGQLAAMLVKACNLANANNGTDHQIFVLDPDLQCPAALVGGKHVPGKPATGEGYEELAAQTDILTVDLENVCVESLTALSEQGHTVIPHPSLLARVTNKLLQKEWLRELDLPTADFVAHPADKYITDQPFGFPVVQKAAKGGYDGRGVAVLRSADDNNNRLKVAGFLERYIDRHMEVSVIVAADGKGDIKTYEPVEMMFHEGGNVLDYLIAPARLDAELLNQAKDLASNAVAAMNGMGIFGVEMFLTKDSKLLINEISPRTHNSGHYTTEACQTSQFVQQLSLLTGQPLGDTDQLSPAVLFNVLGASGYKGEAVIEQAPGIGDDEDVHIHFYGKARCFPGRKMGHVTITGETVDDALEKAKKIRQLITVRGAKSLD